MSNRATSVHLKAKQRKVYVTEYTNELLNNHNQFKIMSYTFCQLNLGLSDFAIIRSLPPHQFSI
ncbi:MAG: hypothetical protein ACTS6G_00530 [Candidatus Hodgkinia cicadicola]